MLKEVSNIVGPVLPIVSAACFATGLFAGRKIGLAAGCKIGGAALEKLGKNADEWHKAGDDYWAQAKKDAFRDLTAVAGFAALGIASGYAGKALVHEEQEKAGVFEYYGTPVLKTIDRVSTNVLTTLYDYKKAVIATALTTTTAVIGAAWKFPVQRNNFLIWCTQKFIQKNQNCITFHQNVITLHRENIKEYEKIINGFQQLNQRLQNPTTLIKV
jgi:hypothetical protein